jgi:hypothetical protein
MVIERLGVYIWITQPKLIRFRVGVTNTLADEAKMLIGQWGREYNQVHPHSSLGHRPPAPDADLCPVTT